METILNSNLLKEKQWHDSKRLLQVREFVVGFYGAAWDAKSVQVAERLGEMLQTFNRTDSTAADAPKPRIEVVYISNDTSEQAWSGFINSQPRNWSCLAFNDPRQMQVKQAYGMVSLPHCVVLDKNLKTVVADATDDILNLSPLMCRNTWVERLAEIVHSQGPRDEEEDD